MERLYHHNLPLEVLLHLAEISTEKDLSDESKDIEDTKKSKLKIMNVMKKRYLRDEDKSEGCEVDLNRSNKRRHSLDEDLSDESENSDDSQKSEFKVKNVMKKRYLTDEMSEDSNVEHMYYNKRIPSSSKVRSNSLESFERENIQFRNDLRERKQHRRFIREFRTAQQSEGENTTDKEDGITKLGKDKRKECEEMKTTSSIRDVPYMKLF